MITVDINLDTYTVTIQGHAQSGPENHDTVCAAASILAYTLAQKVREFDSMELLESVSIKMGKGDSRISCIPKNGYENVVGLVYGTVCTGFALLHQSFPKNLQVYMVQG